MKLLIYISIFCNSLFILPTHDVTIAMFRISESTAGLALDVTLDVEDFCNDQKINNSELSVQNLQTYLNRNTSFQFNQEKAAAILVKDFTIVNDHIKIKCDLGNNRMNIRSLNIQNTCLINVAKHSNIIQIDLNETFRDFRMHKGRTEIVVEY